MATPGAVLTGACADPACDRRTNVRNKISKDPNGKGKRSIGLYDTQEVHSGQDTFFILRKYVKAKALMGASISSDFGESKDEYKGLVAGHAYSVLDARSFKNGSGRLNLLQLRNPWGSFEWKGAWSDNAPEWNKFPKVKSLIKPVVVRAARRAI